MSDWLLWLAFGYCAIALFITTVGPIVAPDWAREPVRLGAWALLFRALRWWLLLYACGVAVGVIG